MANILAGVRWNRDGIGLLALLNFSLEHMASGFTDLSSMAERLGYALAKAREGSQHRGLPVRYLLKDKEA